ncbi:hypothetical protein LL912_01505 [Niabella sp. CC-SYL272]|uniref:hypothetical protein n=1 Tax=Niabella agricola TaxID=2891571 RepID=UPI001F197842|nr:hypothetical protein [Niabella agricola]MCF3107445.1 hypothetical protein [Niabella agricola]
MIALHCRNLISPYTMHRTFIIAIILILTSLCSRAQLVIIKGSKGFANLRSKPEKYGHTTDRVAEGSVYMIKEASVPPGHTTGNWNWLTQGYVYPASDTLWKHQTEPREGYLHASQYKMLDALPALEPGPVTDSCRSFQSHQLQVVICKQPFLPAAHRVTRKNQVRSAIDDRHIWGTDGGIPAEEIRCIVIYKNGREWKLPASAFRSLYQPDLNRSAVYLGQGNYIYIVMAGGDGSGAYHALWIWKNNALVSTSVFDLP